MSKALSLAQPGDVVQMQPGNYGRLTINRQSGADSPKVIVRGDPTLPREPGCAVGCRAGNVTASDVAVCGHGLSVRNLDSTGVYDYIYVGDRRCPGSNGVAATHDVELANIHFNAGTLRGHDLVLRGSRIGPNTRICDSPSAREDNLHIWPDANSRPWTAPYNIRLVGNLIYDAEMSSSGCGGAHSDLVQTLGYRNLTVVGNHFWRCGHSFWQDGVLNGTSIGGRNVFRNNFFSGPCSGRGGGYSQLGSGAAATCRTAQFTIEHNTWATSNNVTLDCPGSAGNVWRSNYLHIGSRARTTCGSGTWDHNVFNPDGTTCGSNTRHCLPAWLDPGANTRDVAHGPNLHISPRDTCLRGAGLATQPTMDIDGDLRPFRAHPDAGADQYESAMIAVSLGIGHVSLGEPKRSVESFYGRAPSLRRARLFRGGRRALVATYRRHGSVLWIAYSGDRVVGTGTRSSYYTTAGGAGVTATAPIVAAAARSRWVTCRSAYVSTEHGVITQFKMRSRSGTVSAVAIVRRRFAGPARCK